MLTVNREQAETTIKAVRDGLTALTEFPAEFRTDTETLINLVSELLGRVQLNSQNSSKPRRLIRIAIKNAGAHQKENPAASPVTTGQL